MRCELLHVQINQQPIGDRGKATIVAYQTVAKLGRPKLTPGAAKASETGRAQVAGRLKAGCHLLQIIREYSRSKLLIKQTGRSSRILEQIVIPPIAEIHRNGRHFTRWPLSLTFVTHTRNACKMPTE
uniref:Uncharacterized protein n=1 Tax=Anopheles christyi TaxID=43041 RepID=A0A182KIN2_9DIPT